MANTNTGKITLGTKVVYCFGDLASQLIWSYTGNYLTIFYTDIVGIAPAIASAILLSARIWDGVNDPMFGAIAERTRSRWGRFRPYILWFSLPLAVIMVLTFTGPFGNGPAGIAWAAFSYIALGMLYTIVNLSYGSMAFVMSYDPKEVMELMSYRMIGTNLGSVFLAAVTMPLILKFSGAAAPTANGYTMTALFLALCALPLFFLVFKVCKEVVHPIEGDRKVLVRETLKTVFLNKPLIWVSLVMLFLFTGMMARIGLGIYYYIYCMKRFDLIPVLMMAPTICTAVSIFVSKNFIKNIPKRLTGSISLIGCAATSVISYFVPVTSVTAIIVLFAVYGLFLYSIPVIMGSIPECIDYMEDKTGVRSDGTSNAFFSLSTKIGTAVSSSAGLMIMAAYGYAANAEQTEKALQGIKLAVFIFPAVMFFTALVLWLTYPMNETRAREIRESLNRKAAAKAAV